MTASQDNVSIVTGKAGTRPVAATPGAIASLAVLALLVACPFFLKNFHIFQLNLMLVYAIAIMGLNLLTGFNGQFSLGHGAFYAIGAYTTAILMDQYDVAYFWTLPVAGIVCFVAGFLFGLPALRLENIYLALATFALAVATPQMLKLSVLEHWTGGVQGIVIFKPDAPFGLPLNQDQWLYFFTLAVGLLLYWAARNLIRSRAGRALMAIRDNPLAARSKQRFATFAASRERASSRVRRATAPARRAARSSRPACSSSSTSSKSGSSSSAGASRIRSSTLSRIRNRPMVSAASG